MQWPYVSRARKDYYRRLYAEAQSRANASEALVAELRKQLELAQRERSDLQLKLLRVGFGINPFHELLAAEQNHASLLPEEPSPEARANQPRPGMSPEEVQATFVREAMDKYPGDLRKIQRHVERRQTEYYSGSGRAEPQIVDPAEMLAAQKVAADIQAAIAEGRSRAAQE